LNFLEIWEKFEGKNLIGGIHIPKNVAIKNVRLGLLQPGCSPSFDLLSGFEDVEVSSLKPFQASCTHFSSGLDLTCK